MQRILRLNWLSVLGVVTLMGAIAGYLILKSVPAESQTCLSMTPGASGYCGCRDNGATCTTIRRGLIHCACNTGKTCTQIANEFWCPAGLFPVDVIAPSNNGYIQERICVLYPQIP
jgi:hypothetical protein